MTKQVLWAIIFLALISFISIGWLNFQQENPGPHNGTVKPAGNYNIEMNSPFGHLYTWLLDGDYAPIVNNGISCEVRLYFPDNTTTDIKLTPFGEDGFTAKTATDFQSCRITYDVMGKKISAKFDNDYVIVQQK